MAARTADLPWVTEFFELFKTPWEPAVNGKHYEVVLVADDSARSLDADFALIYGAKELAVDRKYGVVVRTIDGPSDLQWNDETLPIYARCARFSAPLSPGALMAGTAAVEYRHESGTATIHRIGYDLFEEVAYLLTQGQPRLHAETPTLELHIEMIRRALQKAGVSFVEIPARPHNCAFICCLTHDIDFFGIRRHGLDRTAAGFVLRGTITTFFDLFRGRRTLVESLRNWFAVLSLPFVWLGLARDFWNPFDDFSRADGDRSSTYFLIPFKAQPGVSPDRSAQPRRAARYAIRDIRNDIKALSESEVELAVHGIEAWRNAEAGRAELAELTATTGQRTAGIRMHWLYFSDRSPQLLEEAGYEYDSSWGYNDAVGYRAGTSQVFRLQGTTNLLELPLAIMDTALFYPDRMNLDKDWARARCRKIVALARRFGGALVINWHDRSLAPERQWGHGYHDLLSQLPAAVWFAKAGEAVDWFRWRRSIRFTVANDSRQVRIEAPALSAHLPAACVSVHRTVSGKVEVDESSFGGGVHAISSRTPSASYVSGSVSAAHA